MSRVEQSFSWDSFVFCFSLLSDLQTCTSRRALLASTSQSRSQGLNFGVFGLQGSEQSRVSTSLWLNSYKGQIRAKINNALPEKIIGALSRSGELWNLSWSPVMHSEACSSTEQATHFNLPKSCLPLLADSLLSWKLDGRY